MSLRCNCYPGGFSPETYEGPQHHCPVHGHGTDLSVSECSQCQSDRQRPEWLGHRDLCSLQWSTICDCDPDNPIDFSRVPPEKPWETTLGPDEVEN